MGKNKKSRENNPKPSPKASTSQEVNASSAALKRLISRMRADVRKMESASEDLARLIERQGRTANQFSIQLAQLEEENSDKNSDVNSKK